MACGIAALASPGSWFETRSQASPQTCRIRTSRSPNDSHAHQSVTRGVEKISQQPCEASTVTNPISQRGKKKIKVQIHRLPKVTEFRGGGGRRGSPQSLVCKRRPLTPPGSAEQASARAGPRPARRARGAGHGSGGQGAAGATSSPAASTHLSLASAGAGTPDPRSRRLPHYCDYASYTRASQPHFRPTARYFRLLRE